MNTDNQLPPLPTPKFTETIRGVPCITVTEHEHLMRTYALQARAQVQEVDERDGWTDADADAARLAMELECLLLDCKDNVVVSRWMDSACEALDAWHKLFPYNGPRLGE